MTENSDGVNLRVLVARDSMENSENGNSARNENKGELHNSSIVSSPNVAETNETSNNTTDMPTVTDKENATFANAVDVIERNCEAATTVVNNSMWPFLWPCHEDKDGKLVVAMVDCNWNTWDERVASEITHNILAIFYGKKTKKHAPKAGHDMSLVLVHLAKVNSCIFLQFLNFPTVTHHLILTSSI